MHAYNRAVEIFQKLTCVVKLKVNFLRNSEITSRAAESSVAEFLFV